MNKKKLAAALAAVTAHIKTSEAAMAQAALQAAEPVEDASVQAPVEVMLQAEVRPYNTWGITGRQNLMQANSMMQMRMFK